MNATSQSFLGRYRLVKVLGQGAMGVVYEAVDTRLGRTVAIKTVLRSHLADETTANEYASRFEREAQAAARLSHPHVVTVYDFGEHEDISYIVMEFVRGRELNQAFEAGERFGLPDAIRVMCELLQALDYAHQQGIVHRDVKPANVMLDHAGRVKLTDFGVARVANANQDRTMPGTLVGTPSYMSPEQILGLAVGSRADIFAAGVILYQFLTGKRPFAGGGPFGVQRKIVQDDPEPPTQANPTLPPAFDVIIAKALAKQPEHRYESAAAFAADLERVGATLAREVPLIDLELDGEPPAPPGATPTPAPAPVPPAAPNALNLITAVPFGAAPAAPAAPLEPTLSEGDPEATVLMFKPTAPAPGVETRPPASAGSASQLPRAAGLSMEAVRPTVAPVAAPAPAAAPTPAAASAPAQATLPTPVAAPAPVSAPPAAPAAAPVRAPVPNTASAAPSPALARAPAPSAAAPMRSPNPVAPPAAARAPARVIHVQPPPPGARKSADWWPMAAGALVAAFALGTWLVVAKPWTKGRTADAYGDTPGTVVAPALPSASPSPSSSPSTPSPAAIAPSPTDAAAPGSALPSSGSALPSSGSALPSSGSALPSPATPGASAAAPARTSPPSAAAASAPAAATTSAPAPVPGDPPAERRIERKPEAPRPAARKPEPNAVPAPAPRARDERPAGVEARCTDLLQRMQLGEPLSTEQTTFFQTRCTR